MKDRPASVELVAVTGSSGWIGKEVCAWLVGRGVSVRRLGRAPVAGHGGVSLDLANASVNDWVAALNGCTAVIHCAAYVHQQRETPADREVFEAINVRGTERLLAAAERTSVRRFVFASTIAVYDWTQSGPLAEDATRAPASAYGQSKARAEDAVQGSSLDWRIARLATVYGNGDHANFMRLATGLRRRRFLLPGRGEARKSVLPVERAGELLSRLSLESVTGDRVLNCAAPNPPTMAEICAGFSAACGFPRPLQVATPILRIAASGGDLAELVGLRVPFTSRILGKLMTDTEVTTDRMIAAFPDIGWQKFEPSLIPSAGYYRLYS